MSYLIGGKTIIPGTEAAFKQAKQQLEASSSVQMGPKMPGPLPVYGNMTTLGPKAQEKFGALDITRNAPTFNDPRYTSSTLAIPTDERTLHGLYRFFAETDPIVGAALSIHRELPLAEVKLGQCEDAGVQQHYEEMWDRIGGVKLLGDIVGEYYEIGNVFPFAAFDTDAYMWEQVAILNPDFVKVESTWVNQTPLIKLIPDEALKKVVTTHSPKFIFEQLPPELVKYVLFNQEIPLDPNNVFLIAHAKRPYETKGRSLIKRILKWLMLEDRFNQAYYALATRHAVPITVIKVGDPSTGWLPQAEELEEVRNLFSAYELDPNFSIIYHWGIDVEFYGANGKTFPVGPELDRIWKLKMIGLNVHETLLQGGGGAYSQAYVSLEVQRQRYLNLQLKLENFVHNGLFKPVADLCGFYRLPKALSGPAHSSSKSYGAVEEKSLIQSALRQFTSLRDFKDNEEFQRFIAVKVAEQRKIDQRKEYVFPELDWGALSMAYDEGLKNYILKLRNIAPHLVDDGTLARLAKLDRDTQIKAYKADLVRKKELYTEIAREGLQPFVGAKGVAGGGDMGELDLGGLPEGPIGVGGGPAPIGAGGPPETASGETSSAPASTPMMSSEERELHRQIFADDSFIKHENLKMLKERRSK